MTLLSALACGSCGHARTGHCEPGSLHFRPDASQYRCADSHCLELIKQDGHLTSCPCVRFEPCSPARNGRGKPRSGNKQKCWVLYRTAAKDEETWRRNGTAMATLISKKTIKALHEKYEREHPAPETPAEALCRVARANLDAKVKDLAFAAERSPAWVCRVLKQNGIVLIKPPRKRRMKIKASTLCAACGHPRGGNLAISMREQSHCIGGIRHGHWSNPNSYVCTMRHCLSFNYDAEGKPVACACADFAAPQQERPTGSEP